MLPASTLPPQKKAKKQGKLLDETDNVNKINKS